LPPADQDRTVYLDRLRSFSPPRRGATGHHTFKPDAGQVQSLEPVAFLLSVAFTPLELSKPRAREAGPARTQTRRRRAHAGVNHTGWCL